MSNSQIPIWLTSFSLDGAYPNHSVFDHSSDPGLLHIIETSFGSNKHQLGLSALAGFSLFLLIIPFQQRLMSMQRRMRSASMKWTDKRAKVLLEVLCT